MAATVTVGARPLLAGLPDEIVVWEILLRLLPKYLLRCRAVCRAWRTVTSARDFLLAHHGHQPSLPIFSGDEAWIHGVHHHNMLAFDHRAATDDDQLHAVARLDEAFQPVAACDGLLVLFKLSTLGSAGSCPSICNPATRQHALFGLHYDFGVMGMYLHRPTGEAASTVCCCSGRGVKQQIFWYKMTKLAATSSCWAPTSRRGTSGGRRWRL
jgi:hypothetical protein